MDKLFTTSHQFIGVFKKKGNKIDALQSFNMLYDRLNFYDFSCSYRGQLAKLLSHCLEWYE